MLTQEELKIVERGKELGKSPEEVIAAIQKYRVSTKATTTPNQAQAQVAPAQSTLQDRLAQVGSETSSGIKSGLDRAKQAYNEGNPLGLLRGATEATASAFTAIPKGALAYAPESVRKGSEYIGEKVGSAFKTLTDWIGSNKSLQDFTQKHPDATQAIMDVAGTLSNSGQIAGTILSTQGTANTLTKGKDFTVNAGTKITDTAKNLYESAQPLLSNTRGVVSSSMDIGKGAMIQGRDFGKRIITNLKETADDATRLKTLPPAEAKLIRVGVDDASVKLIKESTPSEVKIYRDLVSKAKIKSGDLLAEQPKVAIGQAFMKPVDHLIKTKNSIGAKLGAIRQKLSNAQMDVTPQWQQFKAYLDSRGITVDAKGKFTGSGNMAPSDLRVLQGLYDELKPDKTGRVLRSQKWIDEWSQRTFKEYDLRQARELTFSDDVTRTVEKARGVFKTALPQEYRTLSTQYSEVMKPIQDVTKLLGYKGDLDKLTTKQIKAAEVALRVIGNASDRPQSVIDAMLKVANKYGYTSDVDLKKVIIFADALEDVYPNITPKRGFTGSTARGINQSGLGVAGDVASGNVKGVLGQVLDSTATQKEVQDALDEFLKSLVTN